MTQLGQRRGRGHAKHARVPQVAARDIGLRRSEVGLFDEPEYVVAIGLNVSIARLRALWMNAKSRDAPGLRQLDGRLDRFAKRGNVGDQVVGRQKEHDRIGAVGLADRKCGRRDGGSRVAPLRLEDESERNRDFARFAVLVGSLEEEIPIGHGEDFRDTRQADGAQERLLQQAQAIGEADKRLGMLLARDGPQSGSGAAGQDHGD